ncbi:PAS domain-containing protein [Actinophytocola sp.]|uniref:PAS domain-containing protein n=1 Tax=Actinophytocola sp. TaxID=1872138 RepID=UPI002D801824|nr:PAS domain-containing protein [Actinophytocola sp.]HET9138822.1 PAS domain-containing protein [Actinophytocola sp.]
MRQGGIPPTGIERHFQPDELIVSKTDPRGVITYANDVFLRMSAYPESEILGAPHNVLRHPDMPRTIFHLLWQTLKAGQEVFAYIVNLAKDGAHYWVFAHVTPSYDADGLLVGYHSNRRVPDPAAVRAASGLYTSLVRIEREHARPAEAIAAAMESFDNRLTDLGQTYDQFVWSLTRQEIRP